MTERLPTIDLTNVEPLGALSCLTQHEIQSLLEAQKNGIRTTLYQCCLGILHTGSHIDNMKALFEAFPNFSIEVQQRGSSQISLQLTNAPLSAFIESPDGNLTIKEAIGEHLNAAIRDLVFMDTEIKKISSSQDKTDLIHKMLRHAELIGAEKNNPDLSRIVCWGGHSINETEYKYTKAVGRELALQLCEFITGCGPGAMRGPFSGGLSAYQERRITDAKFIGYTNPDIITAEPPNGFVQPLVIFPDIEKRLEGFIRSCLGCTIFPGGPGTIEEWMAILMILYHPQNQNNALPLLFTGPSESEGYMRGVDDFLVQIFGPEVRDHYRMIIGNPEKAAKEMMKKVHNARDVREKNSDNQFWNGSLYVPELLQQPFHPTHESVAGLQLSTDQQPHEIAGQFRRALTSIVYGNVTLKGQKEIEEKGPYTFKGDKKMQDALSTLLERFVNERRMRIQGDYTPCYRFDHT